MSFAYLYGFSDRLKAVVDRGGGNLPLVPYPITKWAIYTTKGGEMDFIAWPSVDYTAAQTLWAIAGGVWAAKHPDQPIPSWPLGRGEAVRKTLDAFNPTSFPSEKAAIDFLRTQVFAYVLTVKQSRDVIEEGLRSMDPDYPWTRRITPGWLLGGGAMILLGVMAYKL